MDAKYIASLNIFYIIAVYYSPPLHYNLEEATGRLHSKKLTKALRHCWSSLLKKVMLQLQEPGLLFTVDLRECDDGTINCKPGSCNK
jgi:hypothetical protein